MRYLKWFLINLAVFTSVFSGAVALAYLLFLALKCVETLGAVKPICVLAFVLCAVLAWFQSWAEDEEDGS